MLEGCTAHCLLLLPCQQQLSAVACTSDEDEDADGMGNEDAVSIERREPATTLNGPAAVLGSQIHRKPLGMHPGYDVSACHGSTHGRSKPCQQV